jgi:hypothetical protein
MVRDLRAKPGLVRRIQHFSSRNNQRSFHHRTRRAVYQTHQLGLNPTPVTHRAQQKRLHPGTFATTHASR